MSIPESTTEKLQNFKKATAYSVDKQVITWVNIEL